MGAYGGADLSHEGGGSGVVSLDVTDGHGGGSVGAGDDVVEVAADVDAVAGGPVACGRFQAGDARQGAGQQAGLQTVGEGVFGVVEAGSVQGLGNQAGQTSPASATLSRASSASRQRRRARQAACRCAGLQYRRPCAIAPGSGAPHQPHRTSPIQERYDRIMATAFSVLGGCCPAGRLVRRVTGLADRGGQEESATDSGEDLDVVLMGGSATIASALDAGLVDAMTLHCAWHPSYRAPGHPCSPAERPARCGGGA
ncbi:hypothetical protein GCM10009654_32740 [Streptomyces hebeiensis]|uniref:Bacterial bifunctional deaminase-reductase C-terminal domain-containing protein n=1 Tax=Streptomyces hebeiensis TaxID=229486 RepID=A0ABN1UVD9_9ACTN